MFILSGKCRVGDVGEPTALMDVTGKALFVGDIVVTATIDSNGVSSLHGITAVCSDKWTSYNNGTHVAKDGEVKYFVMGIKGVDFMGADSSEWIVMRVKSHADVIPGEHWKDYGFSYSDT